MKKSIILSALLLLPLMLSGQTPAFRAFYDKYAGQKGYTTVEMSGEMFNVINGSAKSNSNSSAEFMKQIDNLVIIVAENNSDEFVDDVDYFLDRGNYKTLSVMKDGGETTEFYVVQKGDSTSEFVMVVINKSDSVVMSITGRNLNINQISQIVRDAGGSIN